jgi:hypothetical protein
MKKNVALMNMKVLLQKKIVVYFSKFSSLKQEVTSSIIPNYYSSYEFPRKSSSSFMNTTCNASSSMSSSLDDDSNASL